MPSQPKGDVIRRQWEMLRLIPAHDRPGKTAPELCATLAELGYPVTRRTVERDLESLQQCLPLESDPATRPLRWRWRKARTLDIPGMEAAEAMALIMMRDAMRAHLPRSFLDALQSRFAEANRTLNALARGRSRTRWSDKIRIVPGHLVLHSPAIAPGILQTLQQALLAELPIEAQYQSLQDPEPRKRLLYPRALILRGSSLYLIAEQAGGKAPHFYAVQRFSHLRLRELEPFPKAAFDLDAFLADGTNQFGEGRSIRLKATVTTALAKILRDSPLSEDMTLTPSEDDWALQATVRDTWSLHSWLLGHGENIRVQQPASLRDLVSRRLQAAASQYA